MEVAKGILHNALYDLPILSKLGVEIKDLEDSMLMSYLLPWLPRGLKALAYKLTGMEMASYEDTTGDAQDKIAKDYLIAANSYHCVTCHGDGTVQIPYKRQPTKFRRVKCEPCGGDGTAWPDSEQQLLTNTDGTGRIYQPRRIGRRISEILKRGAKLREGWVAIDEAVRAPVEAKLGLMPEATLDDIPIEHAVHYSARDADATWRVYHCLEPMIRQHGLQRVYEIDKGIIPIIARMHRNGIRLDRALFTQLEHSFETERANVAGSLGGRGINLSSPFQVAALLYDQLKLRPPRGQRSTDEKTLQSLTLKYKDDEKVLKTINCITDYRELDKLLGTYVQPLPRAADASDRVHTQFLLHVTSSGRLASRNPNLQNIPTRSDKGKLIRKGFIPKDGYRLVSVDLDQIELRVAAHMSEDENLIEVFRTGKDIHRATAALIYSKPEDEVTTQERLLSKTINFLILYGGRANKLYSELSLLGIKTDKEQCEQYIRRWFAAYPGAEEYMERTRDQAKRLGYVECLFRRRRYVQGVWSTIDKVKEESQRWAGNHPIQGTAAGLLKLWMKRVNDNVVPQFDVEPLLTVHDEIVLEVKEGQEDDLIQRIREEASNTIDLLVPINSKGAHGANWAELK